MSLNFTPFYHKIWSDKKFKKLSAEAGILFIYLFANGSMNLTGIYELDIEMCKFMLKDKISDFEKAFNDIIDSKMIEWDEESQLVWVVNRFKLIPSTHNSLKSPKVVAGAMNELNLLKHQFKDNFIEKYKNIIEKEMWRLTDYKDKFGIDYFLQPETLHNLVKHYDTRRELKKFLINRGCSEQRIDEVIPTVLPNLK